MNATLDRRDTLPIKGPTSFSPENDRLQLQPALKPADPVEEQASETSAPKRSGRWLHVLAGVAVVGVALAAGSYYMRAIAPFESTDDAFIEGHVTAVSPQVAGRVVRVAVKDNQAVQRGDLLVEIDPADFQVRLDQAQANLTAARSRLEQAKAQFAVDQARAEQELASVTAAQAEAQRAQADLQRYQAVETRAVSRSQIDLAETAARSTAAQVEVARNRAQAAQAQVGLSKANIETVNAGVQQAEAGVRQAQLDLSYTRVVAPEDGYVTRRTVENGAYVQTGQALLAVVPQQVWVVANFKETQLAHMKPGQPVEVEVDAYPHVKFPAHVDSLQAGSGSRFSLLPPENASGNYVKVVQRVPVKIVFDDAAGAEHLLGPGMSVTPKVRVN